MSYSVIIPPREAFSTYKIKTDSSYVIKSEEKLAGQVEKIKTILHAYIRYEETSAEMPLRQEKFDRYVKHKPMEQWTEEPEYGHFLRAAFAQEDAKEALEKAMSDLQVTSIRQIS